MEETILQVILSQSFPVVLLTIGVYYFHKQVEKMETKVAEKEKAWEAKVAEKEKAWFEVITKGQAERAAERIEFIQTMENIKHVIEENTKVILKLDETSRTKKVREVV